MTGTNKYQYGIHTPLDTMKPYDLSGLKYYAAQAEAERRMQDANANLVLKKTHMNAGSTRFIFSKEQSKNTKPFLRISVSHTRLNYQTTIVVPDPYVPTFIGKLQEMAKEVGG